MTLTKEEQFVVGMKFKLVGDFLWPEDGLPRKATEEEKALWNRCMGFISEIDLLQPVDSCPHPSQTRVIIRDVLTRKIKSVKCGLCNEYLHEYGRAEHA